MAINNSYAQKKITPVITWLTPESISYGTSLSNTQLNATSNVSGTFSYNPSAGTILNAGTQKLSTTFTPTNKSLYNSTTASVNILVNPAPAIITISNTTQTYDGNPKTVTVTTSPLNIATTVTYTGTSGTSYSTSTTAPTNAGTYSVVAKLNNGNYIAAEASATLLINPGTNTKIDPVISWANPSDIQYGTALGKKQLNATANVSGTFVYTPPSGAVLSAGSQTLSTTFTPTNTSQYNSATQNVTLIVKKATASVTLSNLSQTYSGTPKSANVTTNPAGLSYSITYDSNSGAPTNAGSYSVSVIVNDPNYVGASTATLVINKATPRITITTGGSYTYDGTAHGVQSATVSGVTINGSPEDLGTANVTYNGSITAPVNAGSYSVVASYAGSSNYSTVNQNSTLDINKANQTISVATTVPSTATYNTEFTVTATASSGLPVVYSSVAPLSNTGTNYTMTSGTGTGAIKFNQPGDVNYNPAPEVTADVNAVKASQTITVLTGAPASAVYNTTFTVAATSSSALPVSYGSSGALSNTGSVFTINSGTSSGTVSYSQTGNANYNAATVITQTVNAQKAPATISLNDADLSQPYDGNGKTVGFTIDPADATGVTVIYSQGGAVVASPINVGSYTVTASLNSPHYQASNAVGTLTIYNNVTLAVVTVSNLSQTYDGSPKQVTVTTNPSGLSTSVTYNGSTLVPTNAGSYTVVATITDPVYSGSTTGTLVVDKAGQTITFGTLTNKTYGDEPFTVNATASSGLPVSYNVVSGPATVSGSTVTIAGAGTITIRASQSGDNNYNAATSANQSASVVKASLMIRADDKTRQYGEANPPFTASYLGKKVKIVVLGSSTAVGNNASLPSKSWVGLLGSRLANNYPGITSVNNLGVGGLTTYGILPDGTINPSNRPAVNTSANITKALSLNPQIILINLPSNDVGNGYTDGETINNLTTVINLALAAGVKVFLTGTQPRSDAPAFSTLSPRQRLQTQNQLMLSTFGAPCINIYDELTDFSTYGIKSIYNSGDNLHLNDAGHNYIYTQMFPVVKNWIETQTSGLVNGDTPNSLTGTLVFGTTATATSPAGTYPVTVSGQSSSNYQITYQSGNLTVTNTPAVVNLNKEKLSSTVVEEIPMTKMDVKLWPNPVDEFCTVRLFSQTNGRAIVELYNVNGTLVQRVFERQVFTGSALTVNLRTKSFASGTYFVRLTVERQSVTKQMVVKH